MSHIGINLLIERAEDIVDTIFVSGFSVVQENTIASINDLAAECRKYGLNYAHDEFLKIAVELEKKRHNVSYNCESLARSICRIDSYLKAASDYLTKKEAESHMFAEIDKKGIADTVGSLFNRIKPC